jgi:hypothetical protein
MPRECARTPKIFQSVPTSIWLRDPLTPLLHDALAPARIERSGLLDPAAVKRLIGASVQLYDLDYRYEATERRVAAVSVRRRRRVALRDVIAHQHGRLVERATNHAAIDLRSDVPFVR